MSKRRSKGNSIYWLHKREQMFTNHPASKLVKNRYKALVELLKERYPQIIDSDPQRKYIYDFLKDALYNDRKIRWETEDTDKETKKILSQDYQINELGYTK